MGTPVPAPASSLTGTSHHFVCQQIVPNAVYYHPDGYRNVWWAWTRADDGIFGWVPEVFFRGGLDDEPDGGLRRCPNSTPTTPPSPGQPTPPPTPQPGVPADGDRDGAPDADDRCQPRTRDLSTPTSTAAWTTKRLRPEFKLTPGRHVRLVGGRYKKLGVAVRRLTVKGLPSGTQVVLTCSRSACRRQRATARAGRHLEFKRMRGRKLRTGVRVTLRATLVNWVGDGVRYTVLPNDTSKREYCISPASNRKGSCSTKR